MGLTFGDLPKLRNKFGDSIHYGKAGAPWGTRTPVFAVRGRRPGPLDEGSLKAPEIALNGPGRKQFCLCSIRPSPPGHQIRAMMMCRSCPRTSIGDGCRA